jgi:hypothetical protein
MILILIMDSIGPMMLQNKLLEYIPPLCRLKTR